MRLGSLASARPNYYDRNAAGYLGAYANDLAPHANTTRWTTTIAAGKKMQVESHFISAFRLTASTVVGLVSANLLHTSGATTAYLAFNMFSNNTAFFRETFGAGTSMTLYAADVMSYTTEDLSTGGTIRFHGYLKGTTYDA